MHHFGTTSFRFIPAKDLQLRVNIQLVYLSWMDPLVDIWYI